MSSPEDNGAPASGCSEDALYPQPNDDDQLTWDQSLAQNNRFASTPDGDWGFSSEGHYPSPGNYNQRSLTPLYPGPRDYHSAAQEAYPAHQPVYTRPYIPTFDAIRTPAAAVHQDAPANTEVLPDPVPRERKRGDEQEHKGDQLDQPPKKKR
ncbi:hypothetical protein KCU64_g6084, partial [Aureobasidium melanogenum]